MRGLADVTRERSLSNRMRSRRFRGFEVMLHEVIAQHARPARILDIGGTNDFWKQRGWTEHPDARIVTVNLKAERRVHGSIEPRVGDATNLSEYEDGSFDIVFSNSVIEHLGSYAAQQAMAGQIRRIAPHYWVQTPNYWFPIEPHFLVPGWQWLPTNLRVAILRRRRVGWLGPCPDPEESRALVKEIRLMRRRELRRLFPDATIRNERIGPLVKSFVAVRAP